MKKEKEEEVQKGRILAVCIDERMKRHAMNRLYDFLGHAATANLTEGTVETKTLIYYFRTPVKERLMGMEVKEIIFDVGVSPEDMDMVKQWVRIKK